MKLYKLYRDTGKFYGETTDQGEVIGWCAQFIIDGESFQLEVEEKEESKHKPTS